MEEIRRGSFVTFKPGAPRSGEFGNKPFKVSLRVNDKIMVFDRDGVTLHLGEPSNALVDIKLFQPTVPERPF